MSYQERARTDGMRVVGHLVMRSGDWGIDHCCFAWNRLVDQPWTIMSIGLRNWAHRS